MVQMIPEVEIATVVTDFKSLNAEAQYKVSLIGHKKSAISEILHFSIFRRKSGSNDQHGISVGVESVFLFDGLLIGFHDQVVPAKG